MRKVLKSTAEVFHFWANKVQSEGRAAAVFFEEDKLYSYGKHFCVARHLPSGAVAFTTRSYSVTTSGHISAARGAARHLPHVFCNDPTDSAHTNMGHARHAIRDALANAEKKGIRQTTRDKLKAKALHLAEQANAYLAALPEDERTGQTAIDTSALEAVRASLDAIEAAHKKLVEEQRAAQLVDLQRSLAEWKRGEIITRTGLYNLPPALRLRPDNLRMVETSHGAEIPLSDALALWPVIQRTMRGTKDFEPGQPIGNYRLTKIRADGSLVVGCHDIAFSEIEEIARQLGLIELCDA